MSRTSYFFKCLSCKTDGVGYRLTSKYCDTKCQMEYEYRVGIRNKESITKGTRLGLARMGEVNQKNLKEFYEYRDGKLYYKKKTSHNAEIGDEVGAHDAYGYKNTSIKGKAYKLHRLIFMYHHGYFPKIIDHINSIKDDNRIENLRDVTHAENMAFANILRDEKTGRFTKS